MPDLAQVNPQSNSGSNSYNDEAQDNLQLQTLETELSKDPSHCNVKVKVPHSIFHTSLSLYKYWSVQFLRFTWKGKAELENIAFYTG